MLWNKHAELQRSRGERILGIVQRRAVDRRQQCEGLGDAWLRRRPRTRLGQFGDGGSGEQVLDIERDATLLRLAADGERKHRISANGEEVVVYTDRLHAEHRGEHVDQVASARVRGPTADRSGAPGRGSARRSTLPLAVRGNAFNSTKLVGIM